jgi:hypothetical protein
MKQVAMKTSSATLCTELQWLHGRCNLLYSLVSVMARMQTSVHAIAIPKTHQQDLEADHHINLTSYPAAPSTFAAACAPKSAVLSAAASHNSPTNTNITTNITYCHLMAP